FALPVRAETEMGGKTRDRGPLMRQLKEHIVAVAPSLARQQTTLLIVDDDTHIRALLRQALEAEGYRVREAQDGTEALAQVQEEKPHLIILDVIMPEMSGFDVAAVLKNDPQTMGIPIIMLSIIEDKERGYRLGVDRYFMKPVDTEKLLA